MSASNQTAIESTVQVLRQRAGGRTPEAAILLGSGWQAFADKLEAPIAIPYADLPAFPEVGVGGHAGTLLFGRLGARELIVLSGRKHAYETGRADGMKGAIRSLAAFGVRTLVQTNAAGSLDPAMRPGSLMLIADHLNLPQASPLFDERGDARFVDLGQAYDPALRERARAAAKAAGSELHEGVYAWVMGPQFETPAEIRMLQRLGAQAVGMSTVPETILARHAGLKVLAVSLITNMGCGLEAESLSHAHTLAGARAASDAAARTLAAIVATLELP
jgi:purine-nucleoside phosphorylase